MQEDRVARRGGVELRAVCRSKLDLQQSLVDKSLENGVCGEDGYREDEEALRPASNRGEKSWT
jgi:hypothetical protein